MSNIRASPTSGLSYDPGDRKYWDGAALDGEIERVFDVCHGCRLCFNLCPSFPSLFDAVDRNDGDVRKLSAREVEKVVDDCYQCKLCYVKCPYTADDAHEFDLDFPRLLQRYTAQRAKRQGVGMREKILGNPVALGKIATKVAQLANTANKAKFHRVMMETMLGIHRDKALPEFAEETFEQWLSKRPRTNTVTDGGREVVLFHTCFVNFNNPEIGRDTVEVLERNGVRVHSPKQTCCGMPALDGGDVEFARKQARANVESLRVHVEAGHTVLAINPTCSYMLKKEYANLVDRDLQEDARKLAAATMDTNEYLFTLKKAGTFDCGFKSTPEHVAYHVPCHLRAQNIGFRSRDMMKTIPGAEIRLVEGCCGHDGTWAMKKENFATSMEIGKRVFNEMQGEGCLTATDCPLAAIQIEQATGTKPLHPIQILARAYRDEGFEVAVTPDPDPEAATGPGTVIGDAK